MPEASLGAFVGDDPNGTWTLTVTDTDPAIAGSLGGWELDLATSAPAAPSTQSFTGPALNVADTTTTGPVVFTRQLGVSGAQAYLTDLNLRTNIEHHFDPGELKVWLTSPPGTKVMISNGRGTGSLDRPDDHVGRLGDELDHPVRPGSRGQRAPRWSPRAPWRRSSVRTRTARGPSPSRTPIAERSTTRTPDGREPRPPQTA